jgi:serine/threonine protein kinase
VADESLIDVAAAIADDVPIDWTSATQRLATADELRMLDGLKLIADVTRERGVPVPAPSDGTRPATGSNASTDESQGNHWGPLRIIERVGRGTFGDVYRAWDTRLDREVALKILRRHELTDDSTTVIEEGRLLARIRHPNVVTVYGAERINGRVGVWMEFVHGRTLEDELREHGPFELDTLS